MKIIVTVVGLVLIVFVIASYVYYENSQEPNVSTSESKSTDVLELKDGNSYVITASQVMKEINGKTYQIYAYNNMTPGPLLKVVQGSRVKIFFINNLNEDTTIHWHGLRQDIKDDGVPDISQKPVKPGENYTYNLYFPDAGIYWYHPHIREDEQQDLGLAGNILVIPKKDNYNPINREEVIMLDDLLMDNRGIIPYPKKDADFALMGRYGNVMLVNGKTNYSLNLQKGDVVRLYFTNAANARPFNLSIPGIKLKLVGSDDGIYEKEMYVDSIVIAPGERYVVEVYFENEGNYTLMNTNPVRKYVLGKITVSKASGAEKDFSKEFKMLRDIDKKIDVMEYLSKDPDYLLTLTLNSGMMMNGRMNGMMEGNRISSIEWEDSMFMMNYHSTASNTNWVIKNQHTGEENMDFSINAKVGDKLKIRLFNDPNSMHPMQHPIHLHGQRFLILSIDGKPVENHVWKDTILVPIGTTVDILVDVTNPGEWMFHCHISEHLESGMMTKFIVV